MSKTDVLLVRAGRQFGSLAVAAVVEVMRPLPVVVDSGLPPFVRGRAVIRGRSSPVLDVGALLSGRLAEAPSRWVSLRLAPADGTVALAVDQVLAVRAFDGELLDAHSHLLTAAVPGLTVELGAFDARISSLLQHTLRVLRPQTLEQFGLREGST